MVTTKSPKKLTDDDRRLILMAAEERQRLRREADLLSDECLAEKFEVSAASIAKLITTAKARGLTSKDYAPEEVAA